MSESAKLLVKIAAILLPAAVLVWSLWMMRQHWVKKDPATKHRRTETMMMRPFLVGSCSLPLTPVIPLIIFDELERDDCTLLSALLILGIGLLVVIFLTCYGTRQVFIYDYDHLRHRSAFGKLRTYDFSEVRSMTPIIFDLLVHVGHRWILLDMQQDWHPLWEKYRSWRKRSGLPVKKRTYKTALGHAFGEAPGGIGFLVFLFLLFGGCAAFFFSCAVWAWQDRQIEGSILCALIGLISVTCLVLILVAAVNPEKHPRFSKIMLGGMKAWGKPKQSKPKKGKEDA